MTHGFPTGGVPLGKGVKCGMKLLAAAECGSVCGAGPCRRPGERLEGGQSGDECLQ